MLNEYQNELIGVVSLLLVVFVYIFIKVKSKKREEALQEEEKIFDPYDAEPSESIAMQTPQPQTEQNSPQKQNRPSNKRKSGLKKREIPKHGKITKQDFKEFAGVRVLVADDNPINQKVISGLLTDSGIELVMADDGQEVLEILEKDSDFIMVLMDVHMPRVNGFEATREIRKNSQYDHIVVVALSGDTALDDIRKMSEAGMQEQLEKPLRMDSLYDVFYAYSGSREKQLNTNSLETTQELQVDEGLAVCGGDKLFYSEILEEFVTTYGNSAQKLRTLLTKNEESTADKLLLDIVGVSANIGAKNFTSVVNSLKEALADTQEKSYFTYLEEYQSHLEVLLKEITEYLKTLQR